MSRVGVRFRDPEQCPKGCCVPSSVRKKRRRASGVIWRRHQCPRCGVRWSSYQSLFDPKAIDAQDVPPDALKADQPA